MVHLLDLRIVPHDPEWAALFVAERALLEPALTPWLVSGVQHVGSTAIPGLSAKPILDMLAGVRDHEQAAGAEGVLRTLGYARCEHRPHEAVYVVKPAAAAQSRWMATHHLHLTAPTSSLWRERVAFRDALRSDPALLCEYEDLKTGLAEKHNDVAGYTDGKRVFVARVLASVGLPLPDWRAL